MRPIPRLLAFLAALVVGVDLFNGAVAPLGLPPVVAGLLGLAIGAGAAYMVNRATASSDEPTPSSQAPRPRHD